VKEFGACAPARIRFLEELDPDSIRILSVFSEAVPLFDFLVIVWIFLLETVTASNFRKKGMRERIPPLKLRISKPSLIEDRTKLAYKD
jgi:hypothetical protein